MAQLVRIQRARRLVRRRLLRRGERHDPSNSPSNPRPIDLFLMMLWFGIIAGLLELVLVLAQRGLTDRISLASLRTSRHFVWMIPAADALLFGVCGLLFAWVGRNRPARVLGLVCALTTGLLALSALQSVEGLRTIARLAMAGGIIAWGTPWLKRGFPRLRQIFRATLPAMAAGLVLVAGLVSAYVNSTERRALDRLPPGSPAAPNVLLIVLDDLRADSMSLYGYSRPTTPRLEELARGGVRFDTARAAAPWTLPSHASMFTGQWPHRLSVDWDRGLDDSFPTLAEFLARHGYATAGFVANTYYCNARYGLDRGFARYEDFHENQTISLFEAVRCTSLGKCLLGLLGYSTDFAPSEKGSRKTAATMNQDALHWLAQRSSGRPFFLFLNYYDAHAPFVPPEDATKRFGLCALPRPEQVNMLKRVRDLNQEKESSGIAAEERARLQRQAIDILVDGYDSSIAYLDDQIGRLFDELRRRGLLENTLVIITSDHGEHLQERGFTGHGLSLYRRELHVPLLVFPPRAAPDRRVVAEPVNLRELPATVVDLLGLAHGSESSFPGRSLARFFQPGTHDADSLIEPVLSQVEHQTTIPSLPWVPASLGSVKALTTEKEVYIRNSNGREELYDRLNDPFESKNLITEGYEPASVKGHRETLEQLLGESRP
jgi:arylsulfatase A-like enzyme